MIGPEKHAREELAPDQPLRLDGDADHQRQSKANGYDSRQFDGEPSHRQPVEMIRLQVEDELQRQADHDQRGGHGERPDDDLHRKRRLSEHRSKSRARAGRESSLHDPDC